MGILSRIFAGPETVATAVNAVRDGLDALVYTDEEKAVDAAKDRAEARGLVVQWMQATSGQNLARRYLSVVITLVWLAQYLAANFFALSAIFVDQPLSNSFLAASGIMGGYANQMNGAVMLILGFYFAAPHMSSIVDAAMTRFGNKESK